MSNQVYSNDSIPYQAQAKTDVISVGGAFGVPLSAAIQYSTLPTTLQLLLPLVSAVATVNSTLLTFTLPAGVPRPIRSITQSCIVIQNNVTLAGTVLITQTGNVLVSGTASFLIGQITGFPAQMISIYLL